MKNNITSPMNVVFSLKKEILANIIRFLSRVTKVSVKDWCFHPLSIAQEFSIIGISCYFTGRKLN